MITFLLQCGEYIDITALDNSGKRAIDLCPYSSPIFKSIRDMHRRMVKAQAQEAFKHSKALPMSNYSSDHKISPNNAEEPKAASSMPAPPANQESLTHTLISARESLVMMPQRRSIETMQQLFMLK